MSEFTARWKGGDDQPLGRNVQSMQYDAVGEEEEVAALVAARMAGMEPQFDRGRCIAAGLFVMAVSAGLLVPLEAPWRFVSGALLSLLCLGYVSWLLHQVRWVSSRPGACVSGESGSVWLAEVERTSRQPKHRSQQAETIRSSYDGPTAGAR